MNNKKKYIYLIGIYFLYLWDHKCMMSWNFHKEFIVLLAVNDKMPVYAQADCKGCKIKRKKGI